MFRPALTLTLMLGLAAGPVAASAPQEAGQASPAPGSEAWLRLKGETNRQAPDSRQDPAELAATARLNAEIAARNQAAAEAEAEAQVSWEQAEAERREQAARLATERAQWEAANEANLAAQAQWERDNAAWEARMAACRAAGRVCVTPNP